MGAKENGDERDGRITDMEREVKRGMEGESDYELATDSLSSQGETQSNGDARVKRTSRVPKKLGTVKSVDIHPRSSRGSSNRQENSKLHNKMVNNSQKKSSKPNIATSMPININTNKSENIKVSSITSPEISEESDDKTIEEVKEIDVLDDASNCNRSVGTDDETPNTEVSNLDDDKTSAYQKIEEMELKIEKLEEELREVAALEISLYSIVPEHGSSAHKVHTPARRLSRLYIHACKHWSQDKRATVAKNTVSGLVLIAKSCGNDVSRLTFWLSNTVVLREIISQTFGNLANSNLTLRAVESNGTAKRADTKSPPGQWKNSAGSKPARKLSLMQLTEDWQETSTFIAALEKIETWIFSRIVESVWWQTLTPHMQPPVEDLFMSKGGGRLLGPALGDQEQGNFSINLWKSAFQDACSRLCPVRAGRHECGCLPVLARKVMEQCVARLDVAMFNAILRESASEIPTDPVSDPIVDPKVLPIPAGDLSFGSGAQLKNSIGNWSRWLTDLFGMDADDTIRDGEDAVEDDDIRCEAGPKSFSLLNQLSDLLMLPKDMLLDKAIRKEICPLIGLPLITRVLCNFTPDEFCLDPVPGTVLEELNTESLSERRLSDKDLISSFPAAAAPVVYSPPTLADVAQKVADTGGKGELERRASIIQRKGYTSDDDLDDLGSPLTSIIDNKTPPATPSIRNGDQKENAQSNARFRLLSEVWSA